MNKLDIAGRMAPRLGITRKEALTLADLIIDEIKEQAFHQGNEVCLKAFGVFSLAKKASRPVRHPKKNLPMTLPPREKLTFHASVRFKEVAK